MPLCRFRRQYEQLSQFEGGKIIGMMEDGWSARRVARQLGRSDCVVRRCWDQCIRAILFTRRLGSGRPQQTSPPHCKKVTCTANCFNACHPGTGNTFTIEAEVSSRTIRRRLAEGHLRSRRPLRVLPLTPAHQRLRLKWCRARGNWTARLNQVVFSGESRFNLSSGDNRVRVGRPRRGRFNPVFTLQRYTTSTAYVMI
ncbi:transposable element Tcb2 transposase [Trichonephila clavipes]|uniref:Transposable element Tcb2 transposase n=1 Tax=Trichonephila clavipes TaxID=2585209 RepID=A0A8X6R8N6_TRICX|nr:transposable element Tcb2 transposase [Trichonephila clavipes]